MTNNLFNIKGMAIHCTTNELALETLTILDSMGYKWSDGSSLLVSSLWEWYESSTCYYICENKIVVCIPKFDIEPSNILTAEDFINLYKNNNMQKSNIKSGMSVKLRGGEMGLIVDVFGKRIIQFENNWANFDENYNQDLKAVNADIRWDIMEVYRIFDYDCVIRKNLCKPENLIWKREEVTELTMQEIADKFGVSINSLRIKE